MTVEDADRKTQIDMHIVKLMRWLRDVEQFEKVAHSPESSLYVKGSVAVAIHTLDHDEAEYDVYVGEVVDPEDERLGDIVERVQDELHNDAPTKVIAGYENMRYRVTPDIDLIALVKADISAIIYGLIGEA